MKGRTLVLALVTLAVIVAAWKVSERRAPQTEIARELLFPALIDRLNDVQQVTLRSVEHATRLKRDGDRWLLTDKDDFPADPAKVRRTVLQLAGLRMVEAKTSVPERFARLGVADLDSADATGTVVEVSAGDGAAGAPLAALIVGETPPGSARPQHYVRKVGDMQSWLVEGDFEAPADPILWLDAQIADVDTQRVREVRTEAASGTPFTIRKAEASDNFFALQDVPAGFEAKSRATVSSLGALLLDLRFNDVASASRVATGAPVRTSVVRTFDGLVVTLRDYLHAEQTYTTFEFAFDAAGVIPTAPPAASDTAGDTDLSAAENADQAATVEPAAEPAEAVDAEAQAAQLAARTAGWAYVLPAYKRRMIDRDLDSLIQPLSTAPDAASADDAEP